MHRRVDLRFDRMNGNGLRWLAFAGAVAAFGCTGTIDGDTGPGGSRPTSPPGTTPPGGGGDPMQPPGNGMTTPPKPGDPLPPPIVAPPGVSAAPAPLRRLNHEQYANTVRDLLGTKDLPGAAALPADEAVADRFLSNVVRPVQPIDLDRYGEVADTLAKGAIANLPAVVPCDIKTGDACVVKFIETFGKRAYRRPLTTAEVDRLKVVYALGAKVDATNGVKLVVQALLQSVNFLYLFELAPTRDAGKIVGIDNYGMASRLSYFFWNTMPDAALFAAADAGQLSTAEQVATQARRLIADPRFRDTVLSFHDHWLELEELKSAEKDPMMFPAAVWNEGVKTAMGEETRRFVDHVMREGDGRLETLLTAKFSFLSGGLYGIYGATKPANVTTWQKVDLNPMQRSGILTQAGLLTALAGEDRTSFIKRGKLVREALLCYEVPAPPPGVADGELKIPATATARERSRLHREKPECAVCHSAFDEIGFAFEMFDAIGRFRPTVESYGDISGTLTLNGRVTNALELISKMVSADEMRECFIKQWMRFALGREDAKEDEPSVAAALKAFKEGGGKIPDLLVTLARSDSFRHQKVRP